MVYTYGYYGIPGNGGEDTGTRCLTKVRTPADGAQTAAWIGTFLMKKSQDTGQKNEIDGLFKIGACPGR